ncbi:AT-rich interactive domain-containing protein 5B [Bagarius yarrelli]|uniref:AT-rich interactive domain-containing protein 5B n=1 Tax=Bagarius yarrelli TaxID=175774 RepID=A0A556TIK0_BAGYA|nr:AT-rich interactive domain-containing protein 5B [Bagarius yarrelli]
MPAVLFPQWVGSPCGLHGPYIFYKAFRFTLESKARILSLGDFFFVRCKPGDPVCIAELQLLWEERTTKQLLSSSKLYFLPEDTPQGRTVTHGEVNNSIGEQAGGQICGDLGNSWHDPLTQWSETLEEGFRPSPISAPFPSVKV